MVMSKTWNDVLATSQSIPISANRLKKSETTTSAHFCISVNNIYLNQVHVSSEYQLRAVLYDYSYGQFYGRPWRTEWIKASNTRLLFGQKIYLSTEHFDHTVCLVIELVERNNQPSIQQLIGWTVVPIQPSGRTLTDVTDATTTPWFRVNFYTGTSLLIRNKPIPVESIEQKANPTGGSVEIAIQTHRLLNDVHGLLLDSCLYGQDELVPGLARAKKGMQLLSPSPKPSNPGHIDRLTIVMGHHTERIEQQICELVNREWLFKHNKSAGKAKGADNVTVIERRIRIGVHNGWRYIGQPDTFHLVADTVQKQGSDTDSLGRKLQPDHMRTQSLDRKIGDPETVYVVRQRIDLNELRSDAGLAVVFVLDYLLGLNSDVSNRGSSQSVVVCWGVWCPFDGDRNADQAQTIQLFGGPLLNPDQVLSFKNLYRFASTRSNSSRERILLSSVSARFKFELKSEQRRGSDPAWSVSQSDLMKQLDDSASVTSDSGGDATDSGITDKPKPPKKKPKGPLPPPKRDRPELPQKKWANEHFDAADDSGVEATTVQYPIVVAPVIEPDLAPEPVYAKVKAPVASIVEVPVIRPTQQAIMHSMQQLANSARAIPRPVMALLTAAEFPRLVDRFGEDPILIDPQYSKSKISLTVEQNDPLDCNEIVVQFLALARVDSDPMTSVLPKRVFFTFSFYRFPVVTTESLFVSPNADNTMPIHILRRDDHQLTHAAQPPGYSVKFVVDPTFLRPMELGQFLWYLRDQSIYIEAWHADSLMHLGTSLVPLKSLLRSGNEAHQVYCQVPVISFELQTNGTSRIQGTLKAALYLRLANIGHPYGTQNGSLNQTTVSHRLQLDQSRIRAQPIPESAFFRQLESLQAKISIDDSNLMDSDEKRRKAKRLEAVKRSTNSYSLTRSNAGRVKMSLILENIKTNRQQNKPEVLTAAVLRSITALHTVYPHIGNTDFLEYLVQNPYDRPITCNINISHPQLRVIRDPNEIQYFKQLHNLKTPTETTLFADQARNASPPSTAPLQLFLRAHESVYVPFKYRSVNEQRWHEDNDAKPDLFAQSTTIKVSFNESESNSLIGILVVQVEPQPSCIHQTVRLFNQHQTTLSKYIAINHADSSKLCAIESTDPSVLCELERDVNSGIVAAFVQTPVGRAPSVHSFKLLLYSDIYRASNAYVIQVHVHALTSIHIIATAGQPARFSLVLKADQRSDRMVQAFASVTLIDVQPNSPFMLRAGTVSDLNVTFMPNHSGDYCYQINVVDVEQQILLAAWLIMLNVNPPSINRMYQVNVPIRMQKPVRKKIAFTNGYGLKQNFRLSSSSPEAVVLKDEITPQIGAGEEYLIQLLFLPQTTPATKQVYVYIRDGRGTLYETVALAVTYTDND